MGCELLPKIDWSIPHMLGELFLALRVNWQEIAKELKVYNMIHLPDNRK